MSDNRSSTGLGRAGYGAYVAVSCGHAVTMTLRRRRAILAAGIALFPVLIPLALAFFSVLSFAEDGTKVFVHIVEFVYLQAMAPLLGLFFGPMLVGEEVESQTLAYLLTRPVPRTALVVGRFLAYLLIASTILAVSVALTFTACTGLGVLRFSGANLALLAHYEVVGVMALVGYGAVMMFLGAWLKRPIVAGILFVFGWQRIAMIIPGLVDFLTIEKYVRSLFPVLATERANPIIRTPLGDFQKSEFLINQPKAALTLLGIAAVFVGLTCIAVRWREYSNARAVSG